MRSKSEPIRTTNAAAREGARLARDPYGAIRTAAKIGGVRSSVSAAVPVSTGQRTVVAPNLAEKLVLVRGPRSCTSSSLGKFCGPTSSVEITIGEGCPVATVRAIIATLPEAIGDAIIGVDVLGRAKPVLSFGPRRPVKITCKRQ